MLETCVKIYTESEDKLYSFIYWRNTNTCKLWKIGLFDYLIQLFPHSKRSMTVLMSLLEMHLQVLKTLCRNVSYRKRNVCGLLKFNDGLLPKNPLSPQLLLLQPFFPHVDNLCTLIFSCLLASAFTINLHLLRERYFRNKQVYNDSPEYLNKYGNLLRSFKREDLREFLWQFYSLGEPDWMFYSRYLNV